MHSFEKHIQSTIDRLGLLRRSSPVLVALSGGADSVALLSVLVSLGYDCIAAHCNFHLRGEESVRDMRHSQEVAQQLGVNIYIREFDVPKRMKATGESIEMACRELRYAWFHDLLDRDYSQAIAVAHHREDNVETFFINLLRSSGIAGLAGMDYRRGFVVRPMLDVSKEEILNYLRDKGLDYVTDSSNASNDFRRNRLRNSVIPAIEKNFPGATNAIFTAMSHLRDAHRLLDHSVERFIEDVATEHNKIDIGALLSRHSEANVRSLLFEHLKKKGFNGTQVSDLVRAVKSGSSGLQFHLSDGSIAELDRGVLSLNSRLSTNQTVQYPVNLTHDILSPINIQITPHSVVEFRPERDPNTIYLDVKALEGSPLFSLRHPREGDRMRPYGMVADKLVSDILKDAKFSAARKRDVWLLTRGNEILWIVGLRASAHFALTPDTRRYLRLRFIPAPKS